MIVSSDQVRVLAADVRFRFESRSIATDPEVAELARAR